MKKTIAIVLSVMLLVACFAGCAAKPQESTTPETETTTPDTQPESGTTSPEVEPDAEPETANIEGNWVAESDETYTMEVTADTMSFADGSEATYTFDGEALSVATADGDVEGAYDAENDTITFSYGEVSVTYVRAAQ